MENTKIIEYIESSDPPSTPHIQWEQLRRLMEFQELSYPSLAKVSGIPESTLRKLLQGVTKDPRISTMYPIIKALGASFDRLLGLAPKRDFEREEAHYDVTLMDTMRHNIETMQQRLDDKRARIEELETQHTADTAELDRLRKIVLAKGEKLSAAEAVIQERDASISRRNALCDEQKADIKKMRKAITCLCVLVIIVLIGAIYLIWDVKHPTVGFIRY